MCPWSAGVGTPRPDARPCGQGAGRTGGVELAAWGKPRSGEGLLASGQKCCRVRSPDAFRPHQGSCLHHHGAGPGRQDWAAPRPFLSAPWSRRPPGPEFLRPEESDEGQSSDSREARRAPWHQAWSAGLGRTGVCFPCLLFPKSALVGPPGSPTTGRRDTHGQALQGLARSRGLWSPSASSPSGDAGKAPLLGPQEEAWHQGSQRRPSPQAGGPIPAQQPASAPAPLRLLQRPEAHPCGEGSLLAQSRAMPGAQPGRPSRALSKIQGIIPSPVLGS